jgi:hypothetical protein
MVTIQRQPANVETIDEWIAANLSGSKADVYREVPHGRDLGSCRRLIEVKWKWEVGPRTFSQETAYYCSMKSGTYSIRLSYWAEDSREAEFNAVAVAIVRGFRAW